MTDETIEIVDSFDPDKNYKIHVKKTDNLSFIKDGKIKTIVDNTPFVLLYEEPLHDGNMMVLNLKNDENRK